MDISALLIGAVVAVFVVLHLKATKREDSNWAYPLLLATFPVYYWVFAVYAPDYAALPGELMAGAAFLAIAYVAYKFKSFCTLLLLAVGCVLGVLIAPEGRCWLTARPMRCR
jgi:hypothetical protein